MTIEDVEKELCAAVDAQIAKGAKPVADHWGIKLVGDRFCYVNDDVKCGCIIALWAMERQHYAHGSTAGYAALRSIESKLGLTSAEANSIALGFDGSDTVPNLAFWELGDRIARKYAVNS